jgi:hypothetical protein
VAAGAVNVHVNETRNDDLVARRKMFRILRDANFVAMADLGDLAAFDDDHAIENFLVRREDAAGINGGRGHGSFMLPELRGKNTTEPCILFLLRYNRSAPNAWENANENVEETEWHMTSGT